MSFLSKINGFKFFGSNNPEARSYVHLDGAAYGTTGIRRFASAPPVSGAFLLNLFARTSRVIIDGDSPHRRLLFVGHVTFDLSVLAVTHWIFQSAFQLSQPVPKDSVIDKQGYLTNDPSASRKMSDHYMYACAVGYLIAFQAPLILQEIARGVTFISPAISRVADISILDTLPFVASFGCSAMWCSYAGLKLQFGKWTIQTSPPQIKKSKDHASVGLFSRPQNG